MRSTRIPPTQSAFNTYIQAAIAFLTLIPAGGVANGLRLGLTAQNLTDLGDMLLLWWTNPPAAPGIYQRHTDPGSKTKNTTDEVKLFMKNYRTLFNPMLRTMAGSTAITVSDRNKLNIAQPGTLPTHHTIPISEGVTARIISIGGGSLQFTCRPDGLSKRGKKAQYADTIQLDYTLSDSATLFEIPTCEFPKLISTKSSFTLPLGPNKSGKYIFIKMRWANSKNPAINGPWGAMIVMLVG